MENPELDGCDFSENLLTALSQPTRKPGRPPRISDELLRRHRDELLFVLEENWALIGWELQQAETTSDLRATLRRIQGINCRSLEVFSLDYRRETNWRQLEAACKRLQKVFGKLREAQPNWQKSKDSAELAQSALIMGCDAQKREALLPICEETKIALSQAVAKLYQLQNRLKRLQEAIERREASFAQSELLDFTQSDRYASTPLSFANAMAGLPDIHWRQSMDRCLGFRNGAWHGLTYRRFQIVAEVTKHRAASAEEVIERMKTRLLQAKGQDVKPLNALAENWYFLRRAIEAVFPASRPPEEALPYRIFAEYQRRIASQAPLDRLLAEKEIITTPAYVKERAAV